MKTAQDDDKRSIALNLRPRRHRQRRVQKKPPLAGGFAFGREWEGVGRGARVCGLTGIQGASEGGAGRGGAGRRTTKIR
jgi:hypothetical protein